MKHMVASCLLGFLGLMSHGGANAQVVFSYPGSYLLTSNVAGVSITANNVVLDLGGFTVSQNGQPAYACTIVAGTRGNSCTGATVGNPAITVTGSNVTIKNGIVSAGYSTGINVVAPSNANSNLFLENISVSNFKGTGIDVSNAGVATLTNVQSNQNGGYGILGNTSVTLSRVTANYNNNTGIQLSSGLLEDVNANYNKGAGIFSAGTITKAHAESNGGAGIIGAAVIRDAYALGNIGDGIDASSWGVVTNSTSVQNGGHGFAFATGVCYWGLSTAGNTGSAISGGTPLTGATASCQ